MHGNPSFSIIVSMFNPIYKICYSTVFFFTAILKAAYLTFHSNQSKTLIMSSFFRHRRNRSYTRNSDNKWRNVIRASSIAYAWMSKMKYIPVMHENIEKITKHLHIVLIHYNVWYVTCNSQQTFSASWRYSLIALFYGSFHVEIARLSIIYVHISTIV